MFLVYGVLYIIAIAAASIIGRLVCAIIVVTFESIKETKDQKALLKMDPNSKEYLTRYMPKSS